MKRISIIGSGNVGTNTAFFIAERRAANVMLVDVKDGVAAGKSLDLMEAGPIRAYVSAIRGSVKIDDIAGSDAVIIAAGRVRKPGERREDLYRDNAPVVGAIARDIRRLAPEAVVINIVEPVDLLTQLVQETIGADRFRVMGVGGLLTATRIRYLVSRELHVSPREVTGLIIGPHHPSMVFLRDTIRVSGIPAAKLLGDERLAQLIEEARNAGDTILQLAQRSTSYYAPSAAAATLVDAIIGNSNALLPVSVRCEGEYGVRGLAIGVPVYVGERGVSRVLELKLSAADQDAFNQAAAALRAAHDSLAAGKA
ncbi:MAG TPA: malate dehydrogenase [Alphaproteobacteria bacterium]|nr:malate dehydrogenase [Alphaproteobacteria bacterium]